MERGTHSGDVFDFDGMIGAGGNDDGILPFGVHPNESDAGRLLPSSTDFADVDAGLGKARFELIAEDVVADAAEHFDGHVRGTGPPGGAGLIGAFASGKGDEVMTEDGFPAGWQVRDANDEIHIEAAENDDGWAHRCIYDYAGIMQRLAVLPVLALSLTSCLDAQMGRPPVYGYEIVRTYPHDHGAFTQGLIYLDGVFYEGTGMKGHSSIRKVELATGRVLQEKPISDQYFGEGLTEWGKHLIEITWQSKTGFVWDRETFQLQKSFGYAGEGWGITHDSRRLIMSDGTAYLRFLDPVTLKETGKLQVREGARAIDNLNELEFYKGDVLANIWQEERIARISLTTGQVVGWIDLTGILPARDRDGVDVLNGIAYDAKGDRLFVTGKWWPKLFEIKLVLKR